MIISCLNVNSTQIVVLCVFIEQTNFIVMKDVWHCFLPRSVNTKFPFQRRHSKMSKDGLTSISGHV
jgi:hypothetical protein